MSLSRYARQETFSPIGERGQSQLKGARALVCGCGALGSLIAERLARAGVGALRIVDRDWVEWTNLQRQCLFTEQHARDCVPKAVAARDRLREINSEIQIEAHVEDLSSDNIRGLAEGCDVVLDGTDNFETRFLINDYCVETQMPWIHGGCLGAGGQILSILPGDTPCFRCLMPDLPPREGTETCDSAGVLGSAIGVIASWQSGEAIKLLSGNQDAVCRRLVVIDMWNNDLRLLSLPRNQNCLTCHQRDFPFLRGDIRTQTSVLCGKNAVQVLSPGSGSIQEIVGKIQSLGEVHPTPYFVRLQLPDYLLTIFPGGRTIVEGTTSELEAKNVVSRTLGS